MYELFTGSLDVRIAAGDSSTNLARLMLRMLPNADLAGQKDTEILNCILQALDVEKFHGHIVPHLPKFQEKRITFLSGNGKIAQFLKDVVSTFHKHGECGKVALF